MEFSFDKIYPDYYVKLALENDNELYDCTNDNENNLLTLYGGRDRTELQKYLLEKYPSLVDQPDVSGRTPLFYALEFRNAFLVREILKLNKHAARKTDISGSSAFVYELSVSYGTTEILDIIFEYDNDIMSSENDILGKVQQAFFNSYEKSMFMLEKVANVFDMVNMKGENILHLAVSSHNARIVRHIIEKAPELVRHTDNRGQLPIHLAFYSVRSNSTISKILYDEYPESIEMLTDEGHNPIHKAYMFDMFNVRENDEKFLHDVMERAPACLERKSYLFQDTPVMIAMKHRMNDVHTMLRINPKSFELSNSKKENPLHILCIYKPSCWVVTTNTIAEKMPELLYKKDVRGKTPIDYGCEEIGVDSYQAAKEIFLTNCLKLGTIEKRHWGSFSYPATSLVPIIGMLINRSKEEANNAMKLIRIKNAEKIRETLMALYNIPVRLEPEMIQEILVQSL